MLRYLPLCFVLLATPSAAATFSCASPEGDLTLSVERVYDAASNSFDIASARFQIAGDIGYTSADDPNNGGTVTLVNVVVDPSTMTFDFHLVAPEIPYDGDVAMVRLVTLNEGQETATGGVIRVVAGGVWPLFCTTAE